MGKNVTTSVILLIAVGTSFLTAYGALGAAAQNDDEDLSVYCSEVGPGEPVEPPDALISRQRNHHDWIIGGDERDTIIGGKVDTACYEPGPQEDIIEIHSLGKIYINDGGDGMFDVIKCPEGQPKKIVVSPAIPAKEKQLSNPCQIEDPPNH